MFLYQQCLPLNWQLPYKWLFYVCIVFNITVKEKNKVLKRKLLATPLFLVNMLKSLVQWRALGAQIVCVKKKER